MTNATSAISTGVARSSRASNAPCRPSINRLPAMATRCTRRAIATTAATTPARNGHRVAYQSPTGPTILACYPRHLVSPARRWVRQLLSSPAKVVTVLAVIAALLWWQWPLIAGYDSRTDVVLLTDGFLTSTEPPVTYRIHEDRRSLQWDADATSWCGAADAVRKASAELDPAAIVLSFANATGCDTSSVTDAVRAAHGHRVLIVAQPGRSGIE